jgi:tetratricopeptide (TPR) repeat protein
MRAAGDRVEAFGPALAAAGASFCALFFGGGLSDAPLVWIGAIALLSAAVLLLRPVPLGGRGLAYLGCLGGLALWCGLSILWSASPDRSWAYTNRTLVYAGFAFLGVLLGARLAPDRIAGGATTLVALVLGWALLAKCVPALYADYGRIARLRDPIGDWNMLALVCVVAVVLALWLSAHSRLGGVVLLYLAVLAVLLTYSRFGVALACLAAAAWIVLEPDRVECLAAVALGGGLAAAAFGAALALPGITSDRQPHGVRAHDGWIFALVVLGGAALVALVALALLRLPPLPAARRRTVERAAGAAALAVALAGLAVTIVKASTIWREFTNPVAAQTAYGPNRFLHAGSGNRWTWWQEAWREFTGRPGGGTGAGTFQFTDLRLRQSTDVTAIEPHNVPLQFLGETGVVGFLLYTGAVAVALLGLRRRDRASRALAVAFAAFVVHTIVNYDWNFVAVCGPLLLLGGVLVARPAPAPALAPRPLLAAGAVLFALACVYSLAAPWLAQRTLASATTLAQVKRAHAYDPLSTDVLTEWAAFARGDESIRLYRDALALEPTNSSIWFELAQLYASNRQWVDAYRALSKAFEYDPFGPAGQCGIAATIRRKVGVRATCRGAGSASSP